jgi:hypothetical protein
MGPENRKHADWVSNTQQSGYEKRSPESEGDFLSPHAIIMLWI